MVNSYILNRYLSEGTYLPKGIGDPCFSSQRRSKSRCPKGPTCRKALETLRHRGDAEDLGQSEGTYLPKGIGDKALDLCSINSWESEGTYLPKGIGDPRTTLRSGGVP